MSAAPASLSSRPSPAGRAGAAPDFPSGLALRCRGITKVYETGATQVHALRGIDLEVRRGELLMLVGPSGCGKTTLISVMAGILDQTAGECLVFGHDLRHMPVGERTRFRGRNIGFVFQSFNLLPPLTAVENVAVPLLILGEPRREALRRAHEALRRVGLAERGTSLPSQLSGGQQQRVAIARALVHGPRLIVCDEPTSSLDHETGHKVLEILRTVTADDGRALVIVTHDARVFGFADRIAQLDDGRVTRLVTDASELPATQSAPSLGVATPATPAMPATPAAATAPTSAPLRPAPPAAGALPQILPEDQP